MNCEKKKRERINLQISYLLMITARTSSSTRTLSLIHIHAVAAARRGSEEEAKHETIKLLFFRLRVRFSGEREATVVLG